MVESKWICKRMGPVVALLKIKTLNDNPYTNFRKNYKEFTGKPFSKDVYIKDVNNEFPINTFDWKKSPQGRDHWSSLDNKWFETWFKPFYDAVSGKNQKEKME